MYENISTYTLSPLGEAAFSLYLKAKSAPQIYFAKFTALRSRITVIFTCPG